jgi:HlyD family secretion protein
MNKRVYAIVILILLALALIVACSGQAPANKPTAAPTPTAIAPGVKGKLVPRQFVEIGLNASGVVAEVPVSEGQPVKADQVLLRLDDTRLKLAVEQARLKLKQAELDLDKAQKPAEPADLAAAEKAIQAAQVALANTQGVRSTTIDQAQNTLRSAELALDQAQRQHNKLLEYKSWGYDVENELRSSQVQLDNLHTELEIAQRDAAGAGTRANQSIVETQQALASAQAKYEALKRQPEPESVQAAQLAVESAKVALARAEANLKNATLAALVDGVVAEVKVKAGQQAESSTPLITLADTSVWYVETDNLTELTVVGLKAGGKVNVRFDALPELKLPGRIERIAVRSQDKRGEVTYTARVALESADPRLRWGMTAVAEFEK